MKPILSICIPTYKRGQYAYEATKHVLDNWDGDEIQVVVGNDASPDDTDELMKTIDDPRLVYYKNDVNLGAAYNTHLTFMKATGEYAYLTSDEDDIILDEIPYLLEYFKKNPDTSVFIGGGDLTFTRKRFANIKFESSFDALMNIGFKTRYMTGIILRQKDYADKLGWVTFEESPEVWDAYSFMYAIAHLCCTGKVVTSDHLLFKQTRFKETSVTNNARTDGIYYYEPIGRINQMKVWMNTIFQLNLKEGEKITICKKIMDDTVELASRVYSDAYVDEVRKTVPKEDFEIYYKRIHAMDEETLAAKIRTEGTNRIEELIGR